MSSKPSVLVFGGLPTVARAIASFLVPDNDEPLVSHVRLVDKYSIKPPTTYIGPHFPKLLENPIVEYRQVNVTRESPVSEAFDPPDGIEPYSYIIDATGQLHLSRPEELHVEHTALPSFLIGQEATKRKVKAYVRLTPPLYETALDKIAHGEGDALKPSGIPGIWYHESLRILANFHDLNLVIVRPGLIYGPWLINGLITPLLCLGLVYQESGQEFKNLWSADIRHNTIHIEDVAGATWAAAEWISKIGRTEANKIAGEDIYFANDKSKIRNVKGAPDPGTKLVAPLFNVVDDSDTTLQSINTALSAAFGIKTGFHGLLHNAWAQLKPDDVLEEINEEHMEVWTKIITTSNPPVPNTPLSPYLEAHMLEKRSYAYKGGRLQKETGFKLRHPAFGKHSFIEMIEAFKEDGTWPNKPGTS